MDTFCSFRKFLAGTAALASLGSLTNLGAQITFTELVGVRTPSGISDDGSVVVGNDVDGGGRPVRWTASTNALQLGTIAGSANGVSADGSIVVGTGLFPSSSLLEPFRWTQTDGVTKLKTLNGAIDSRAVDVAGDGSTSVGFTSISGQYTVATRWNGTDPQALGFLPGGQTTSMAAAVSADGSTIVGYAITAAGDSHAVRWTENQGLSDLGPLGGSGSLATDVSADGTFVVGYILPKSNSSVVSGFIWDETGGKTVMSLAGTTVMPRAVSADGSFVAGYTQRGGNPLNGFLWTPGSGLRDLSDVLNNEYGLHDQLEGWSGLYAWSMSSDGRFVGGSGFHDGLFEGWLLDRGIDPPSIGDNGPPVISAVPEPSMYGVIGSFLLAGLVGWRERNRRNRLTCP